MRKQLAILIVPFFLFIGCANKNNKLNDFISGAFPDLETGEVMVLPGAGCNSCISEAENSIDSLIKRKDFRIVFSQIESQKLLKQRLKAKNIDWHHPNVFLDTADVYLKSAAEYNDLWAFPTIITVKNNQITKVAKL